MVQVTVGMILFIFAISSLLCVGEGATHGENCTSNSDCTADLYMQCDTTCVCTEGYVVNSNAVDGCLPELGYNCNDAVPCQDEAATCDNTICKCNTTAHYDSNGLGDNGGSCVLKHDLGVECPNPNTDACATTNAACSVNTAAANSYTCQCTSTYKDDDNGKCLAYWSEWSAWGVCSVTCGGGTQTRTRTCSVTGSCSGDNTEDQDCNIVACPIAYGGICGASDTCAGSDTECTGGKCQCVSTHYWGGSSCITKIELGESCPTASATCSVGVATCRGDGNGVNTCQCPESYYDDNGEGTTGGNCVEKLPLEASCPIPTSLNPSSINTCSDVNAGCTASNGIYTCQCFGTHYDNKQNSNRKCVSKVELGIGCPMSDACATANALCSAGTCKCGEDYYDTNTADIEGGSCTIRLDLNGACTIGGSSTNYLQCKDINARCINTNNIYRCSCNQGYHEDSDTCIPNIALGEYCEGVTGECSDPNAECRDSKCTCSDAFYDANGNCRSISELQVTGITFSEVQTTQFVVSWTHPSGKESYISGYTIGWYPTDNSIAESSNELGSGSTTYTITAGITPGKAYRVSITSINDKTELSTLRSTSSSKEQAAKPGKPGPINKQTSDLDIDGGIRLYWAAPSGSVSGYKLTLSYETDATEATPTSASVLFTPSWLLNGHRYNVTIQAKSQTIASGSYVFGEIYTEEIKTVVKVPSEPLLFTCYDIKDESIVFTWQSPTSPNGDLVSYIIEVYNINEQLQFTNDTSDVVLKYEVDQLSPGTSYIFQVYTRNENFTSTDYGSKRCTTKAKLSDPPNDLNTTNITSRNFEISWDRPTEIYSEEIYGYVLQIKRDDVCVKEVVYKCSDCIGTLTISSLENMCSDTVREVVEKSKVELGSVQTHTVLAGSLRPDTTYAISVTAVNKKGKGNVADITQKTTEEAPKKPTVVSVGNITTTSFKVTWNIEGYRPGPTNYTVILSADSPAESKEYTVIGFAMRTFVATQLEEFWNYTVEVKAATSIDGVTSDVTGEYRTLPAAPGVVTEFNVTEHPSGDYTKLKISWKEPDVLESNSIIKEYTLIHNATEENEMATYNSPANSGQHETTLSVTPEHYYSFQVFAVNEQGSNGSEVEIIVKAPAGVPKNEFELGDNKVIPEGTLKDVTQTKFTLFMFSTFFTQDLYGSVQTTGLLGCAKGKCDSTGSSITLENFNEMPTWQIARTEHYTTYRITETSWLQEAMDTPTGRRRRDVTNTDIEYTVGADNCASQSEDQFCNGPLEPNTQYYIVAVVCTNGGCLLSNQYGPYITAAIPPEPGSPVLGIMAGVVVVMAVAAGVAFIIIKRRRNEASTMGKANKDDEENKCVNLDPELAKITRNRPIQLQEIEEYVINMHKDSNLLFSAEYDDLKALSPKHACEAADREENRMRNRYINIIAFDHTRVKLSTNGEDDPADYINANYLPGYTSPREYIGCQGPLPGTIDDFWRMVWEQNVSVIVMLTLCKEGQKVKCEQYWPDEVAEAKQYGDVIVEITSYSTIRTYDYRMFKITNGDKTRVIKHFHFLSWLDFQANVHHDIILDFIQHVRGHVQPPDTSGPMIVHCSAGVGRTGTYIALDHLMQFINEHNFDVQIDIFDMVLKLRDNRQHMVQTEQQYVFIHDSVKEIMDRKRRALEENLYENQAFSQDEDLYQNENENLYANVSKSEQNTEL